MQSITVQILMPFAPRHGHQRAQTDNKWNHTHNSKDTAKDNKTDIARITVGIISWIISLVRNAHCRPFANSTIGIAAHTRFTRILLAIKAKLIQHLAHLRPIPVRICHIISFDTRHCSFGCCITNTA